MAIQWSRHSTHWLECWLQNKKLGPMFVDSIPAVQKSLCTEDVCTEFFLCDNYFLSFKSSFDTKYLDAMNLSCSFQKIIFSDYSDKCDNCMCVLIITFSILRNDTNERLNKIFVDILPISICSKPAKRLFIPPLIQYIFVMKLDQLFCRITL